MKKLLIIIIFFPIVIYSQSRNASVHQLNSIIDYMDECSRINRQLYWDVKQFSEGYLHSSAPKRNDNYWWTHSKRGSRIGPFDSDRGRFPELHVDNEGMISDFEYELYPVLVTRENMDKLLQTKFFTGKENIRSALMDFKLMMDSLIGLHRTLYDYVGDKSFLNDPDFKTALSIIDHISGILDDYYLKAKNLIQEIAAYYETLPVLSTQKKIITAKSELDQCKELIEKWADELYDTINNTAANNQSLHALNDGSLAKDSALFYGTYGFGYQSHGAMPHTRYITFYEMMKSTLYWYAKDKLYYPEYMTERDVQYNEFVDRIHLDVEDYNDFLECADGKKLSENLGYSMKIAAEIGIDTNQNVLLKWPRKGYLFHFVKKESKEPVKTDIVSTDHQQLINNASPHHMVFLLDVSASMGDPGKIDLLKEGAKYLVGLQRPSDHISLLTFSTHSNTLLRNVACDEKIKINTRIDELHTHGATNASEGIKNAFGIADSSKNASGISKIILVTDGKFQLDGAANKLLSSFKKKDVQLIIFLVGSKVEETLVKDLSKIAQKGNGRFYAVDANSIKNVLVKEASDG